MLPRHVTIAQAPQLRSLGSKAEAFLDSLVNHETAGIPAGAGTAGADGFDLVRQPCATRSTCKARMRYHVSLQSHYEPSVLLMMNALRPSQGRMHALLAALGQPQQQLRVAHITGTKGKGSTATMLSAILQAAQYRVGTYTRQDPS